MKEQHPELSHVEVNKIVGQLWRNLSDAEKNAYKDKAKVMQETDTSSQHKCPKCDKNFENPNLVISHLIKLNQYQVGRPFFLYCFQSLKRIQPCLYDRLES